MTPLMIGSIGVIAFIILLVARMPIAIAMAVVGVVGFGIISSPAAALKMAATEVFTSFNSYNLSVIPMYVWMGFLAYYSGLGSRLFNFAYKLIGHFPGGLAMATQVASAMFGAVCGSNTATAATMGAIALPEMKKYEYDQSLSTASIASGGILGILIPPSVTFIVYGVATEQSIGKLFMSGIGPGILLMLLYIAVIYILTRRNPKLAPPGPKATWKERWEALRGGLFEAIVVFVISVGGLSLGWFTPTEAGAVGAGGILAVVLAGKKLTWEGFKNSLTDTAKTTAMIMFIIACATIFGRFIAISRIPFALANWVGSLLLPSFIIMWMIVAFYLVAGCVIDSLPLILLTIPIFYPIIIDLGYDPIWFGVIIVLVSGMGVITPPVGINVYIIKGVAKDVPLEVIFKGIWPFLYAIIICIAIVMAFPQIVLFLPNLM
jgi:tripartite ATP-independent transporter DctM subunit